MRNVETTAVPSFFNSMNSQSLVYVHMLLLETRVFLEAEHAEFSGAFDAYDNQQVRPKHVHRGKEEHLEAVRLLFDGFDESMGRTRKGSQEERRPIQ